MVVPLALLQIVGLAAALWHFGPIRKAHLADFVPFDAFGAASKAASLFNLVPLERTPRVNRRGDVPGSCPAFAAATDTRPNQHRFRLNIMLETDTAFAENDLLGKRVRLGGAELQIVAPVGRCAAIDVDPETAVRGPHYLPVMEQAFGHTDLGVFAEIISGGPVSVGDQLTIIA